MLKSFIVFVSFGWLLGLCGSLFALCRFCPLSLAPVLTQSLIWVTQSLNVTITIKPITREQESLTMATIVIEIDRMAHCLDCVQS